MLTGVMTSVNKCCLVDIFMSLWDLKKGLKHILPIKNFQIQVSWGPLCGRSINLIPRSEHRGIFNCRDNNKQNFVMHYIVTIKLNLLLLVSTLYSDILRSGAHKRLTFESGLNQAYYNIKKLYQNYIKICI